MRCQAAGGQVTLSPMADNDDARSGAQPRATLLLTRPRAASERFAADVAALGLPLDIVISPLMEIVPTEGIPVLSKGTDVIFTSSHAVEFAGPGAGRRAWCVGTRTANAASDAGFEAVMAGACAEELIARLLDERPGTPLAHLHGTHQRGDVARRLADAGLEVASHVLYDQVAVPPDAAFSDALARMPLLVALFSPRSAALFASAAGPAWRAGPSVTILTLSLAVQSALPPGWGAFTVVAEHADGPSMLDAISRRIFP
jgi:uroporphyrinogen-III synthase